MIIFKYFVYKFRTGLDVNGSFKKILPIEAKKISPS